MMLRVTFRVGFPSAAEPIVGRAALLWIATDHLS
jgi:hypothetical protein